MQPRRSRRVRCSEWYAKIIAHSFSTHPTRSSLALHRVKYGTSVTDLGGLAREWGIWSAAIQPIRTKNGIPRAMQTSLIARRMASNAQAHRRRAGGARIQPRRNRGVRVQPAMTAYCRLTLLEEERQRRSATQPRVAASKERLPWVTVPEEPRTPSGFWPRAIADPNGATPLGLMMSWAV